MALSVDIAPIKPKNLFQYNYYLATYNRQPATSN